MGSYCDNENCISHLAGKCVNWATHHNADGVCMDFASSTEAQEHANTADGKKLVPVQFPWVGDLPQTTNCPVCNTLCHR